MKYTDSQNKYRPDIDGLRAIAVVSVVIFHAFPTILTGGFIGVDIFFVISGFLITSIILNNIENNKFSFLDFYSRRVKRIFPALILVLTACYVFGWILLLPGEYKQLGKHIASGIGFVANIVYWGESGYFDSSAETKPLLHLWSLGVEEQFYIFFPLIIWCAWKFSFNIFSILIFLFFSSFSLNVFYVNKYPDATFYLLPTRAWEMISGGVLAYATLFYKNELNYFFGRLNTLSKRIIFSSNVKNDNVFVNILSFSGLVLLIFGFFKVTEEMAFPGWIAVIPVLGTIFVIASGQNAWINRTFLSNKIAVWFGLISFPLYLWHWPLLVFPRMVMGEETSFEVRLAAVFASVVLSWITLKIVEKPLRHGGRRTAIFLIASGIFTLMISVFIYKNDGFMGRFSYMERMVSQFGWNGDQKDNLCISNIDQNSEFCRLSKDMDPSILLVGDSISWQLYFGLAEQTKEEKSSVLAYSQGGCAAFFGFSDRFDYKDCLDVTLRVLDRAKNNQSVKTVIFSSRPRFYADGLHPLNMGYVQGEKERFSSKEEFMKHVSSNFSGVMSDLIKSGKQVIFVKNNPSLSFDPKKCVTRPWKPVDNDNCVERYSEHVKNSAEYNALIDGLISNFPEIKVFDPAEILCDKSRNLCYPVKDGSMLYRDNQHLSVDGSRFIGKYLYPLITQ